MVSRILKSLGALAAGHGIQTITQFLVPVAFVASYGLNGYGEWLALSAAVGYLSTLDFGLQTYVLNELTKLYHRNELQQFHRVQSVGLRLMLGFVAAGTLVASLAFVLPVGSLLKLQGRAAALSWTVFLLALQLLATIPMGQIVGVYRTFGQTHRGVMWANLYRSLLLVVTLGLTRLRLPFWAIAAGQGLTVLVMLAAVLVSLWRSKPEVSPRIDYWDGQLARQILKPSAFFGLVMLNTFLVYQAPVLLLQRFLGSEVVVAFSVARMLFSFVRQGTALLQQGIGPEITRLEGAGDKARLVQLYVLVEGVLLATALTVNAGLLLAGPVVLRFWLKLPELFELQLFVPVMLVSVLASVKEYKIYFQYATNQHVRAGVATCVGYCLMVLASVPAIHWFGVTGFLAVWLATESLLLALVHYYNARLFGSFRSITLRPSLRLGLALSLIVLLSVFGRSWLQSSQYLLQAIVACVVMVALAAASYFLFNLRAVLQEGLGQLLKLRFG
jgi:O-antigen/teichoic acid export membrane protein